MRARNIKLRNADCGLRNFFNPKSAIQNLKSERGVGLIELLVSVMIMAGLAAAILVAYTALPGTSSQTNALMVLQQEASLAMEEMSGAIRETTVDSLDVQANQLATSEGTYTINSGLLYKDFGLAGQEILLGDYTFEAFAMQVASFQLVNQPGGTNTVEIVFSVDLTQTLPGGVATPVDSLNFRTRVYPRNRL